MVASLGIFLSTIFRKNVTAIITAYICLGLLGLGPVIAIFMYGIFYNGSGTQITYGTIAGLMFPSPVFGFISFMAGGQSSFFGDVFGEIQNLVDAETSWIRHFEPWMINGAFNLLLSGILLSLSAWKLNPVKKMKRISMSTSKTKREEEL